MLRLGLTGGIGTGKSTSVACLNDLNICVLDTDAIARELTRADSPILNEILATFGTAFADRNSGELDRVRMADLVFRDTASRECLEAILHPPIRRRWIGQLDEWRKAGARVGVIV